MIKASLLFSLAILGPACARHACNAGSHQSHHHGDSSSIYNLKTSETSVQSLSTSQSSTFSTIVSISSSTTPLPLNTSLTSASVISPFSTPSTPNLSVSFPTTTVSSPASSTSVSSSVAPTSTGLVLAPASFSHPGLLHTDKDFARIRSKLAAGEEPWTTAWNKLLESSYASSSYVANPVAIVYRGYDGTHAENYGQLYRDMAAAYVLAIRWAVT
ncbi:putative GPI anchored protein [Ilyonectria robusta]